MLIRAIRAEDFMRFSRLALEDLPQGGVIGVEGPNESGKSTLGEVLLFAFFGKTRLAVESPVHSLIRWGADSMQVEVEFSLDAHDGAPGGEFLIFRQADRFGTNYVKVVALPERREIASGNVQVAEFVGSRIGFESAEFQQSFYHDQYEIRRVQTDQVAFFEAATGLNQLKAAVESVRAEVEPMEREFSYFQREIARNIAQAEKYERNAVKVPELEARLATLDESLEGTRRGFEALSARAETLRGELAALSERGAQVSRLRDVAIKGSREAVERIAGAEAAGAGVRNPADAGSGAASAGASIVAGLERLSRLMAGGAELLDDVREARDAAVQRRDDPETGALARTRALEETSAAEGLRARRSLLLAVILLAPTIALALLTSSLVAALSGGSGVWTAWKRVVDAMPAELRRCSPFFVGGFTAILAASFLFQVAFLRRHRLRQREAEREARAFAEEGVLAAREASELTAILDARQVKDIPRVIQRAQECSSPRVAQKARELRSALLDGDALGACIDGLVRLYDEAAPPLRSACARAEKEVQEQETSRKKLQADRCRLLNEVRECQSQAAKKEALEEKNAELDRSALCVRSEIDARLLAVSLLEETAACMRAKMGPTLTRIVKSILPRLTAGRYREVKVEPDLEIKVFSGEKNDFLTVHELSGGTNEALSLALRLAVSQALVAARSRGPQFVFLDEPFKMMDPERALETLNVLRTLSPDLRQFFVIQPRFGESERRLCDLLLTTSRDSTVLEWNPRR